MGVLMRAVVIGPLAGLGIGLLALSVYHTTTVGNCASGPTPFAISNPCPSNTGWWFGALFAGIAATAAGSALIGGGIGTGVVFLTVGGACVASLVTGADNANWFVTAIILAALFIPMGVGMLVVLSTSPPSPLLLPFVAAGAFGALMLALAIPGPLEEPKNAASVAPAASPLWYGAAKLRAGLADVVEHLGPSVRVLDVNLEHGDAIVTVVLGAKRHDVHVRDDGSSQDYISAAKAGAPTVALNAVDVQAPARVIDELGRRFDIGPAKVGSLYFGVDPKSGPHWFANLANNQLYFQASVHGTGLLRLHE